MKGKYLEYTEERKQQLVAMYGEGSVKASTMSYFAKVKRIPEWMLTTHPVVIYGKPLTYWTITGGLGIIDIAKELGISYQAVSRWVHQEAEPRGEILKRLKALILEKFPVAISLSCDVEDIKEHIRENFPCVSEKTLETFGVQIVADVEKVKSSIQ